MDSRSRFSSISLVATVRFGRPRGRSGPSPFLVGAAVITLLLNCGQTRVATAQIPGVVGGGVDAGLPRPAGPSTPTASGARRSEVFDSVALAHTRTFCVDMRNLESWQAAGVKEFLATASQPKEVLHRLPWQPIDDCGKADAVARIYFVLVDVREETSGAKLPATPVSFGQASRPVLLLYDKASIRLFYRAEGEVFKGNAVKVLASPFALLVRDLEKINGQTRRSPHFAR